MKVCTCFLFTVLAHTYSSTSHAPAVKDRSVNLALETVLEFSNKDNAADLKFLDKIQNFIKKVKSAILPNQRKDYRRDFKTENVETLTDFVLQVIGIISTYKNKEFQQFFDIFDEEIRKYHYRGCKFYELTENQELRKLVASKLDLMRTTPVVDKRKFINVIADVIRDGHYDVGVKELVNYINSLYRPADTVEFERILERLHNLGKTETDDLAEIIKDGIRSIIFDHYTRLTRNARLELKNKINDIWNKFRRYLPNGPDDYINSDIQKIDRMKNKLPLSSLVGFDTDFLQGIKANMSDLKIRSYTKLDSDRDEPVTVKHKKRNKSKKKITKKRRKHRSTKKVVPKRFSKDPSTGETLEKNSIELDLQKQRGRNTQRYITLYTEEITYKPKGKTTTEIAIYRSGKRTTSSVGLQTLWVELMTGRVPKSSHEKHKSTTHKPKHHKKKKNENESKIENQKTKKDIHSWKQKSKHGAHETRNDLITSNEMIKHLRKRKKHKYEKPLKRKPMLKTFKPKKSKAEIYGGDEPPNATDIKVLSPGRIDITLGTVRVTRPRNTTAKSQTSEETIVSSSSPILPNASLTDIPLSGETTLISQQQLVLSPTLPNPGDKFEIILSAADPSSSKTTKVTSKVDSIETFKETDYKGYLENRKNLKPLTEKPNTEHKIEILEKEMKESKRKINTNEDKHPNATTTEKVTGNLVHKSGNSTKNVSVTTPKYIEILKHSAGGNVILSAKSTAQARPTVSKPFPTMNMEYDALQFLPGTV